MFHKDEDFAAFIALLEQACERLPMRVLAYCVMPNHFHVVLWPLGDGDLSRWMQWLLTGTCGVITATIRVAGTCGRGVSRRFPSNATSIY